MQYEIKMKKINKTFISIKLTEVMLIANKLIICSTFVGKGIHSVTQNYIEGNFI